MQQPTERGQTPNLGGWRKFLILTASSHFPNAEHLKQAACPQLPGCLLGLWPCCWCVRLCSHSEGDLSLQCVIPNWRQAAMLQLAWPGLVTLWAYGGDSYSTRFCSTIVLLSLAAQDNKALQSTWPWCSASYQMLMSEMEQHIPPEQGEGRRAPASSRAALAQDAPSSELSECWRCRIPRLLLSPAHSHPTEPWCDKLGKSWDPGEPAPSSLWQSSGSRCLLRGWGCDPSSSYQTLSCPSEPRVCGSV